MSKSKFSTDEERLLKQIANRIRRLRLKAGYSGLEYFAYDAGISRAQYGRYEKGENLTILSLLKVLKFHKMSIKEFFSEDF